ncbi:hypothetical protein GCM10017710_01000 [Arthrobacter ramosus]
MGSTLSTWSKHGGCHPVLASQKQREFTEFVKSLVEASKRLNFLPLLTGIAAVEWRDSGGRKRKAGRKLRRPESGNPQVLQDFLSPGVGGLGALLGGGERCGN